MQKWFIARYFDADKGAGSGGNSGDQAPAPEGQGTNQGQPQTGTQPDNTGDATKAFTQADIDRIVKERLKDQATRLDGKFQTDLSTKLSEALALKDKEVATLVQNGVQAELARINLENTRTALKARYSLTDDQVGRLKGDTADDLTKDAEAIYGSFSQAKPAPIVPTGASGQPDTTQVLNLDTMTPEQIRQNKDALWKRIQS